MSDWQTQNAEYLAASLSWLRLLLEQQAQQQDEQPTLSVVPMPKYEVVAKSRGGLFQRKQGQDVIEATTVGPVISTIAPNAVRDEEVQQAANKVSDIARAMKVPPALVGLSQQLGMSGFEQNVLLLCAAMELDTRIAALCARAQDDAARPYPTFALAMILFEQPSWDALSPQRALRYWRLLEINQPAAQPLTTSALRADERIVSFIKGLNYLDDRLHTLVTSLSSEGAVQLPPSQQAIASEVLHTWRQGGISTPVVQLVGTDSFSKTQIVQNACQSLQCEAYRLPIATLPTGAGELDTLARLWQRESILLPLVLYLDAQDLDGQEGQLLALNRFFNRSQGVFVVGSRDVIGGLAQHSTIVEVRGPTEDEQLAAWESALGKDAGDFPAQLAAEFNLHTSAIERIAETVLAEKGKKEQRADKLWHVCRRARSTQLDRLAQKLDPKMTWDDLILPPAELELLRQLVNHVRQRYKVYRLWGFAERMNRGLGISALFAGDSGTGKTMAAEVVAQELKLDLYRIDLSAVVSKYIGETEKNLRRVFDAAEEGGAILLFDEADALFGKRSEVKDSHDRYANIEIDYLLQRIEAYRGLAILTSNMKSALDTAFMRRLRFVINFPFPGVAERKRIWQRAWPSLMDTSALDFDKLGKLNLTGGGISNVALSSAFLAAQNDAPLTMDLVKMAAMNEFRKTDREADFRW